jgi:hypothetical protein
MVVESLKEEERLLLLMLATKALVELQFGGDPDMENAQDELSNVINLLSGHNTTLHAIRAHPVNRRKTR